MPLAAGENHYLRYEFQRLMEDGAVARVPARRVQVRWHHRDDAGGGAGRGDADAVLPALSITGINMAATIHVLASLPNRGYFEADMAKGNGLRSELCTAPYEVSEAGQVQPLERPGIGVEVDEDSSALIR